MGMWQVEQATRLARVLWAIPAVLLLGGGALHAAAFGKAARAIAAADLPVFFAHAFMGLWLIDSATLILVGLAFGWLAWRPGAAARPVAVLLGLIPIANGSLVYLFVGRFPPAHVLVIGGLLAIVAALIGRPTSAKSAG